MSRKARAPSVFATRSAGTSPATMRQTGNRASPKPNRRLAPPRRHRSRRSSTPFGSRDPRGGKPATPPGRRTVVIDSVIGDRRGPLVDAAGRLDSRRDADEALVALYSAHYRSLVRIAALLLH